jgi:Zn-dependent membrane protease YugP
METWRMTGLQIARRMAPLGVTVTIGVVDYYDPATRNIHLARRTAVQTDYRAHARAAHEAAHSVQHHTRRRVFRVWQSWPVQSPLVPMGIFLLTLAAVLASWHPWPVASAAAAVALARVGVVLWVEHDATRLALAALEREGILHSQSGAYLRRQWWSYVPLAFGL